MNDSAVYGRKWLVLASVSLGMFMALLDATIVNIAVPAIMDDLRAGISLVSWVINAYNLGMVALFLSAGRLADRLGQKRVFIAGLAVFTLFSLACGLAPNIGWLIVFRVGQAVGGAAMAPISLSILLGAFPQRQHGLAVGLWGALGTVAAALGPSLGGVLVEYASWHWIFIINLPIGLIALAMALSFIPERRRAAGAAGLDVPGIVISSGGLFAFTLALIQGNDWGWSSPAIIGLLIAATLGYPLFIWWELRTQSPMFDIRLLRIRSFTAANTAMLFIGTAMGGALLMLVIFLVNILGYSELRAALAITPMPLTALVLAPNVGRLVDRIGPRVPSTLGAFFFAAGMALLSQLGADATLWDATWRVVVLGCGLGLAMPTLSAAAMGSLPPEAGGVGSGALATFRQIGFVLGVAILVSIFSNVVDGKVTQATREAVAYVNSRPSLPPAAKAAIVAELRRNVASDAEGDPAARLRNSLGSPSAGPASPTTAARQTLALHLARIYRSSVAEAFTWPFIAAAVAALLAAPFTALTGRRLGEHAGHHEQTRDQRRSSGGRAS